MTDEEIDAKLDAESLVAQTFDHATLSRRAALDQVRFPAADTLRKLRIHRLICCVVNLLVFHSLLQPCRLQHSVLLTCCIGSSRALLQLYSSFALPRHC